MVSSYRYRHYGFNWRQWITPGITTLVLANTAVLVFEYIVRLVGGRGAEFTVFTRLGLVPWAFVHGWI